MNKETTDIDKIIIHCLNTISISLELGIKYTIEVLEGYKELEKDKYISLKHTIEAIEKDLAVMERDVSYVYNAIKHLKYPEAHPFI